MIAICIKQHLSNIWSSSHEIIKQHWGWVEKKDCFKKKCVSNLRFFKITYSDPRSYKPMWGFIVKTRNFSSGFLTSVYDLQKDTAIFWGIFTFERYILEKKDGTF